MSGLTPERLAEVEALTAKVIEVFGDDWPLEYDTGEDEVVCRYEDEDAPFTDVFIVLFRTSQWPEGEKTSPLAEFLASSVKVVPQLLAEVNHLRSVEAERDRLRAELAAMKAPTDFHNADHIARLKQVFTDTITEFADRPEVAASQVMLYAEAAVHAVERQNARIVQAAEIATALLLHRDQADTPPA